jgi:HAD superfamily hydrolase (TIGR01509 family)
MATAFRGVIFDVDGVLVDSPHEQAWRDTLRELMETRWSDIRSSTAYAPERFTPGVYQNVVAGKPRMAGARAVLDYFEVPDADGRVAAYADCKQEMVVELIEAGRFTAFPDALRLLLAVRGLGLRIAAASSSKNAALMLGRITIAAARDRPLLELRDVDISGRDFARGKPDPEIFLTACEELGVAPHECFVVEDAVAGVEAAKAGGMAALGIARGDDAELLAGVGADLVVTSLDDVALDLLAEGRLAAGPA